MADNQSSDTATKASRSDGGVGMGTRSAKSSDDWLTPPWVIEAVGPFVLDPCASVDQPWRTAFRQYTIDDDGFNQKWFGLVWLNPPYGRQTWDWLGKLAEHGNGVALTFARTEVAGFFEQVWEKADAIFFFRKRLTFHLPVTGEAGKANAGGPSCLVAYGGKAVERLGESGLDGVMVEKWKVTHRG